MMAPNTVQRLSTILAVLSTISATGVQAQECLKIEKRSGCCSDAGSARAQTYGCFPNFSEKYLYEFPSNLLTKGEFALKAGKEFYVKRGKLYIVEECSYQETTATRINNCDVSEIFAYAKDRMRQGFCESAERYFRLAAKLIVIYQIRTELKNELIDQYGELLKKQNRVKEAELLQTGSLSKVCTKKPSKCPKSSSFEYLTNSDLSRMSP